MNEDIKSFIQRYLPNPPPFGVNICKKDQLEAKRHTNDLRTYQNGINSQKK